MSLLQDVDSIIAEENINDSVPAVTPDEVVENTENPETPEAPQEPETPEEPADPENPEEPETPEVPEPEAPKPTEPEERSPTETITEAKTLIQNLNLTEDKVFNEDGSVKPWKEVVPAGAYLASQLNPVSVTDKDGKVHEFMLLSDVEKAFPEGFDAKNNIEQMKFERAILNNETKFDEAVKTYEQAEARYQEETSGIANTRAESTRIAGEYKAMADAGLVPKIGDTSDPKFGESEAVKELNTILEYMDTKNTELAKQGIPPINSLYVAKQFMASEGGKVEKEDKKQQIINERNEVASLSSSPAPDQGQKQRPADIPLSRLADEIIASEGLK